MRDKVVFPIIIACGIVLLFAGVVCGVIFGINSFFADVPKPSVDYGEFPFKLVYEKDHEIFTIEDTLVIEYDGVVVGKEKMNRWIIHRQSEIEKSVYRVDPSTVITLHKVYNKMGNAITVNFLLGSCEYYMGLEERPESVYAILGVRAGDVVVNYPDGVQALSNEELYAQYGIKIIETILSDPIA